MKNRKTANLLPEYLRTEKNKKFLSSTIDSFIQVPELKRIDSYVGSKESVNYNPSNDFYLEYNSKLRNDYSLEPALVFKNSLNEVNKVIGYDDIINEIKNKGGKVDNLSKLFDSKFYSFDPLIDWDKLINYSEYYWLIFGPDAIDIDNSSYNIFSVLIGKVNFDLPYIDPETNFPYKLSNGMKIKFSTNASSGGVTIFKDVEYIVEGVGKSIVLVDFRSLQPDKHLTTILNETFDSENFDYLPFDGDRRFPINQEYVTINKSSRDLNPWTRYNRWFHREVIEQSAKINNKVPELKEELKAKRPIVEFKPNIQLYNFGKTGKKNVDLFDETLNTPVQSISGVSGVYIDGVLAEVGQKIIFNAALDPEVRKKIYTVVFNNTSGFLLSIDETDEEIQDLDSISVNYGKKNAGKSFYFNATDSLWHQSQQHLILNESPLFDLFNNQGISYTKLSDINNFLGNKIFGYEVGTGNNDPVLGFPLKYENSIGVGSYLFKNYFMTDVISVTSNNTSFEIYSGTCFIKINNENGSYNLTNVWNQTESYKSPIIEIQVVEENTTDIKINSIDNFSFNKIVAFVNNKEQKFSINYLTKTLEFSSELKINDVVILKIITDEIPNQNGYFQAPLNLVNNPLNSFISTFTLTELSDHLMTMIDKITNFEGVRLGKNNLRDINNYSKYGSRLIINTHPLAFPMFFLGKKEHDVTDSIRAAAIQYYKFKLNLLKLIESTDNFNDPVLALDELLINVTKNNPVDLPYYNSDMLGFGNNKKTISYVVDDVEVNEFDILENFKANVLSFNSLLIYLNNEQLVINEDYTFNYTNDTVTITQSLNLNDVITFVYYFNTGGSFIPPTPSKLGLYPKFKPEIINYSLFDTTVQMIRCHDGSLIKIFNDYRDNIILEFEKRIFNNIKVEYNKNLFDIKTFVPGFFRSNYYSMEDIDNIIRQDFLLWANNYNVKFFENNTFDSTNELTWNYKGSVDKLLNKPQYGSWEKLFLHFFDTVRPHTHPWEMLGFDTKPQWWDTYYSWTNPIKRSALIEALTDGNTAEPPGESINLNYARPGIENIIPVDNVGKLKSPDQFLLVENSYQNISDSWNFGDFSPYESIWRNSSLYPFALNIAAAILKPCEYLTSMYDVSRTSFNIINQLTYTEDDLYLNLNKLVVQDDTHQISGYGNYIIEQGKQKYINYINILKEDLLYCNFSLFNKLGGFSSKDKLQISIDSIDPVSSSYGVVLPLEDYKLFLNESPAIDIINISGIIVQKNKNKFLIKGYDQTKPYFNVLVPEINSKKETITVGGVSEKFVDWNGQNSIVKNISTEDTTSASTVTTKYYKQGQIVRYEKFFYKVKISHVAQDKFDPSLFQKLPKLPLTGGVTVLRSLNFSSTVKVINYNSEFSSIQEVYDIIVGYGAWLETKGFIFDTFNSELNQILDWKYSGKEFLFWCLQNWNDNTVITLSPFSQKLKFNATNSIVDSLINKHYNFDILKSDGRIFSQENFRFSREDNLFEIENLNNFEGIYFVSLRLIQKEHGILINNSTIFNDTVYDIETGYKQKRIKLYGFITDNWNGDYFSPGFIYDDVKVETWESFKNYKIGSAVKYNNNYYQAVNNIQGTANFDFSNWTVLSKEPKEDVIPNLDYKINQFEDFYSLDVDNFDIGQQKLSQHLVGYTSRNYLNGIFSNPISQYKFYQGFISEKGTKNSIDKITKAKFFGNETDIKVNEEWAFRVGYFGGYSSFNELEFNLKESLYLENPFIIKIVDSVSENKESLINYISSNDILIKDESFNSSNIFFTAPSTFDNNNLELLTAGYPRISDVTATVFNKNSILDIANFNRINEGDTFWLGFLENGDWDVYRYTKNLARITGVFVSSPGIEITFTTDINHNLSMGDIISVINFNDQVNGIYIVKSIPKLRQFTVSSELTTIINEELLNLGILFEFKSIRYSNINSLIEDKNLINLDYNEKFWLDKDSDNKWSVYQKIKNYTNVVYSSYTDRLDQLFGSQIFVSDSTDIFLISAPNKWKSGDKSYGYVTVYRKNLIDSIREYEFTINDITKTYCDSTSTTEFGSSVTYDINKKFVISGAPAASKIIAPLQTGTVVLTTGTGTIKSFLNEGIVKVSSKKFGASQAETQLVIVNPNAITSSTANYSRFGHSIYINQVNFNNSTTLLISAPGDNILGTNLVGSVYAYHLGAVETTATNETTGETGIVNSATIFQHSSKFQIVSTSSVSLNAGSRWGEKISGNANGTVIGISAPGFKNESYEGLVQIFDNNLNWKQTLYSPFNSTEKFADDFVISKSGKFLLASSKNLKTSTGYGKVAIYILNTVTSLYSLTQIIENPIEETTLKFGNKISISDDELTLAISSSGTNNKKYVEFKDDQQSIIFDNNTTKFNETVLDSGAVHLYTNLGDLFVNSSDLNYINLISGNKYGESLIALNNSVFVGAPSIYGVGVSKIKTVNSIIVNNTDIPLISIYIAPPDLATGYVPSFEIVYETVTSTTKKISSIIIKDPGNGYISTPVAYILKNAENIGNLNIVLEFDKSKVYQFNKIDKETKGFKLLRKQEDTIDILKFTKSILIDTTKDEIVDYLDIVDPLKGKILGIAEQELTFKNSSDPAIYSLGQSYHVVDTSSSWLDEYVGNLWWDLSTAKFLWYEQGEDIYRKNNWGQLFPGASIDIYEWVKSDLLPSEWAAQADTNEGLTKGISGQPKFPDNSALSVKQVYNNITGAFENVYYFWVKNKAVVPPIKNRRISSLQVAQYISDPLTSGEKFVQILSKNSLSFSNIHGRLVNNNINFNIGFNTIDDTVPKHTEWLLLEEGNKNSVPNKLLEKKLFDSLMGHDELGNSVPDLSISERNRYGISIRPNQSIFKNRLEALRNVVEFANSILINERITGNYNFVNLNKVDEIPDKFSGDYDFIIDDPDLLELYNIYSFERAELSCVIENKRIKSINIDNPGLGYILPPKITIENNNEVVLKAVLDESGKIVAVNILNPGNNFNETPLLSVRPHIYINSADTSANKKWTKNVFDYVSKTWIKEKTQIFNTPLYWHYVDWVHKTFNKLKSFVVSIPSINSINNLSNLNPGDYIKVENIGNGNSAILEKTNKSSNFIEGFNILFVKNGTIQIKDSIWSSNVGKFSYDTLTLDETLYDQIPDIEIFYILKALKEDIFINDLKVNWNLLFFTAVRYSLTEQKLLDWAFKTSFINVNNKIGKLNQKFVYQLDKEKYFEEYLNEIKPYHTKIRNYKYIYSAADEGDEIYKGNVTDFDLPSYFNTSTNSYNIVNLTDTLINQTPWKDWKNNYKGYISEIVIIDGGSGYTQRPTVTIETAPGDTGIGATAEALIRKGEIFKIVIKNKGKDYTVNPKVIITGGGNLVTRQAKADAVLKNDLVRQNTVGIKFDRIKYFSEINNDTVTEKFICDGTTTIFELRWAIDPKKENIIPRLDGRIVFATDYTIEYSTLKTVNSKFVFLKLVPNENQIFEITYKKNINVFSAIERIDNFYQPTSNIEGNVSSLLMNGIDYGNNVIQGLPFEYYSNFGSQNNAYGNFVWGSQVEENAGRKPFLTRSIDIGDTRIYIDSINGIAPNQQISIVSSNTNYLRKGTIVEGVFSNIDKNQIYVTLKTHTYNIKFIKIASNKLIVRTKEPFNGNLLETDKIKFTGITTTGINDVIFDIEKIDSNNTFILQSPITETSGYVLLTSTATFTIINTPNLLLLPTSSGGQLSSSNINDRVFVQSIVIDYVELNVDEETFLEYSAQVKLALNVEDYWHYTIQIITDSILYEDQLSYSITGSTLIIKRIGFIPPYKMIYARGIKISFYENPKVEFLSLSNEPSILDSVILHSQTSNFLSNYGYNPEQLVIDGEKFLSNNSNFAPEELIQGHMLDSLGINVYTKTENLNAIVYIGAFAGSTNGPGRTELNILPDAYTEIKVYSNDTLFTRITAPEFSGPYEFYLEGNFLITPQQEDPVRLGYTIIKMGGKYYLDSNAIFVDNTVVSTATVESSIIIDDIKDVFVIVDNEKINELVDLSSATLGYQLTNSNINNNRACVKVYNLPAGKHTISAWFFSSKYNVVNKIFEEAIQINSGTSVYGISNPVVMMEPKSSQVIVEKIDDYRTRLLPPKVTYHTVRNRQNEYDLESDAAITADQVRIYLNGVELRPGFDYKLNASVTAVKITKKLINNGDSVAIEILENYDFIIINNQIKLKNTPTEDGIIQLTSYSNHDNLLIRTETFVFNLSRRYTVSRPILNDNYVWVFIDGKPLINRYDFEILDDNHTILLSEWVNVQPESVILITTFNSIDIDNKIIGFRVFKDMFERLEFNRITELNSTYLAKELTPFDIEIEVYDNDGLITPNPGTNSPGVVLIDGERIEFFAKNQNKLRQLRRSTLGTAPAKISYPGTSVIDQTSYQKIPYVETTFIQKIKTTNTNTYTISTVTTTATGQGIIFTDGINAIDQVLVFYGGRQLRKHSLTVHDLNYSFNVFPQSLKILPPEFSINTATQQLSLNITEKINTGTQITVIKKQGYIWTGTESLLTSDVKQAEFLRDSPSVLPDVYYYGGPKELLDENYESLTDDNDEPLEE